MTAPPGSPRRDRIVAAVALALLTGCGDGDATTPQRVSGSGDVITDDRDVEDYDEVVLAGEGRVVFGAAPDGAVVIEGDDNLVEMIETDVSAETLTIGTRSGIDIEPTTEPIIRLGCPRLSSVRLDGAGSIDTAGCASTVSIELVVPGAGRLVAPRLDADEVRVRVSGAGDVEASGRANRLRVDLPGAGNFDGSDLESSDVDVGLSGVGAVTVWATELLDIEVSGAGTVRYRGVPQVSQRITGVGTVEALGPA